MLTFIIANIVTIQWIALSIVGAFIGEFFRSTSCPVKFTVALAEFLASALFAFLFTTGAQELGVKSKALLSVISLYTGFIGYKVTSKHAKRIFDNFLAGVKMGTKK